MSVIELYNWVRQCSLWGTGGGRKTTDDQNMTADIVVCDVRFEAKEALDEQNSTIESNGLQGSY